MPEYKLTYFSVRALGEHIRFMFHAAGVPFEDITVDFAQEWATFKNTTKYQQLPILEVDGKQLTQSLAIGRYLGKELGFTASDSFLNAKADEIVEFATELRLEFRVFLREPDAVKRDAIKKQFVEVHCPKYYKYMNDLVAETPGDFITGNKVVWQDFFVANWLQIWSEQDGPDLIEYPALKKLQDAVFAIPAIKKRLLTRPVMFV